MGLFIIWFRRVVVLDLGSKMGRVVRGILVRIVVVVRSIVLWVILLGLLGGWCLIRGVGWEDGLGEGGGSGGILCVIGGGEVIGVVVVVIVFEV